jgi:peroxiredoxin
MHDVMASPLYRDLMTPKLAAGDPAYAFELPRDTGETVRLANYAGRLPVALVFGSYT